MHINIDSPLGKAAVDYLGEPVVDVDVYPDPNVPGAFAVRVGCPAEHGVRSVEFLVSQVALQKVTADDLEEVQFSTWPPQVR